MSENGDRGERIAKRLSRAGVASRRDAERMVAAGRVEVNGKVVDSPALTVTAADRILVDGKPLAENEPARLWLYHKPAGLVTTARDELGRETVFDQLPEGLPRVMSVGRLDLTSEGLLLLTNDGALKRRLELPATGWLRKYRVRVNGTPDEAALEPLRRGIVIGGEHFQPMTVVIDRQQGANAWLTVSLREGRNREVRRAMEAIGLVVNRLIRISYGPFRLGALAPGAVEEVKQRVLREQLGPQGGTVAEGPRRPRPVAPARAEGPKAEGTPADGLRSEAADPSRSLRRAQKGTDAPAPGAGRAGTGRGRPTRRQGADTGVAAPARGEERGSKARHPRVRRTGDGVPAGESALPARTGATAGRATRQAAPDRKPRPARPARGEGSPDGATRGSRRPQVREDAGADLGDSHPRTPARGAGGTPGRNATRPARGPRPAGEGRPLREDARQPVRRPRHPRPASGAPRQGDDPAPPDRSQGREDGNRPARRPAGEDAAAGKVHRQRRDPAVGRDPDASAPDRKGDAPSARPWRRAGADGTRGQDAPAPEREVRGPRRRAAGEAAAAGTPPPADAPPAHAPRRGDGGGRGQRAGQRPGRRPRRGQDDARGGPGGKGGGPEGSGDA